MGLLHNTAKAILMGKLADIKLCGDTGCSCKSKYSRKAAYLELCGKNNKVQHICVFLDALSMATALDDFVAPDCRFINIKRGQMVYVYSKLLPMEGAGVFWSGSVCTRFFLKQLLGARSFLHMRQPICGLFLLYDRWRSRNKTGSGPLRRMRQLFYAKIVFLFL